MVRVLLEQKTMMNQRRGKMHERKDIGLNEIPGYLSLALVGRFCEKSVDEAALCGWMDDNWKYHLKQMSLFHILSRSLDPFQGKNGRRQT